jgi:hypothetical protein
VSAPISSVNADQDVVDRLREARDLIAGFVASFGAGCSTSSRSTSMSIPSWREQ